jgi:hypothetical protein
VLFRSATIKDGYSRVTYERDRLGDVLQERYFGKSGQPIAAFLREAQAKVLDYVVHGSFGFERIQPLLTGAQIPHPFSWSINYLERVSHHRDGEIRFASEDVYRNCQTISLELVVIADSSAGTSRLHINHRLGDVSAERAEHIGRRFLGLVEGLIGSQDSAIAALTEG